MSLANITAPKAPHNSDSTSGLCSLRFPKGGLIGSEDQDPGDCGRDSMSRGCRFVKRKIHTCTLSLNLSGSL